MQPEKHATRRIQTTSRQTDHTPHHTTPHCHTLCERDSFAGHRTTIKDNHSHSNNQYLTNKQYLKYWLVCMQAIFIGYNCPPFPTFTLHIYPTVPVTVSSKAWKKRGYSSPRCWDQVCIIIHSFSLPLALLFSPSHSLSTLVSLFQSVKKNH